MTTNESLKHWLTILDMQLGQDNCSAMAMNNEQIWKHKSWIDQSYLYEVTPSDNHIKIKK